MKNLRNTDKSPEEWITDCYLITMLGIFPLFCGFEGYGNITIAKVVFFFAAAGLWLAAMMVALIRQGNWGGPLRAVDWAAFACLAVLLLSFLCSPWRAQALIGAGRYDGFITSVLYLLMFLGVSRFTRPKICHAAALALGTGLCCALAVVQLFGLNPLGLYPSKLCFYDSGLRYSGAYLGTVGNTNILDAILAISIPLCAGLWLLSGQPLWLIPMVPELFVVLRAGGGGIKAALLVCLLAGMPLLLTEWKRVRRALWLGSAGCTVGFLAFSLQTEYIPGDLRLFFLPGVSSWYLLGGAAFLLLLSLLPEKHIRITAAGWRRGFVVLSLACLAGGFALVLCWPGESGTLWELRQTLRGAAEESFGSSRFRIWRDSLALATERPGLGGGPGTISLRLNIHFSRLVPETGVMLESYVDNAHNVYLGQLVNCGVPGLLALLAMEGLSIRRGIHSGNRIMPALILALLGGMVHGLFGLGLCISEPVFWAILGLCVSSAEKEVRT